MSEKLSGAKILLECLKEEGIKEIFGYPGAVLLGVYEELYHDPDIKHYLVRHEQAAIHAAEGVARTTGRPGVALVTSGPGATNTITGIANAYMDGYPMIVLTGQVATTQIGGDAFQEADIVGMTRCCSKHNYLVKDVKDLARIVKEAFYIATTGKPGPVVIDLPKDILYDTAEFCYPKSVKLAGYNPTYKGHPKQCLRALEILSKAKRPVIISGGGTLPTEAYIELTALAKALQIPVAHTLMGIGSYPANDELALGMLGMHGTYAANHAVYNADVIFAVGTRFNDRITGSLKHFGQEAQVIHIDIDPRSISKNVHADIPIVGDAKNILETMLLQHAEHAFPIDAAGRAKWIGKVEEWKKKQPKVEHGREVMLPQTVIQRIYECTKDINPIICTEVGQHQMWAAALYKFEKPRSFVTSGGLGTMGFGFPAAVGAQVANPKRTVINIAGDGSIQMNIQELMTCVEYKLPIIVAIINNGYLGMVRQWQERMLDKRYSQTKISSPDFVRLAEAYGAKGIRVQKEEDIAPAMAEAVRHKSGPVFVEFIVEPFEAVYPWVLAGKPINQVLLDKEGTCEE